MTDDPDRQADLDWLYGRPAAEQPEPPRPSPGGAAVPDAAAGGAAGRPRVSTPAYDTSHLGSRAAEQPRARHSASPSRPQPAQASRPPQRPAQHPSAAPAPQHARPAPRKRRRRSPLRIIVILLVAFVIWLVAVPVIALGRMGSVEESDSAYRLARQPGTAVLLVGSDSREGVDGARADTILILYRPPTGRSVLISLPRDSYVTIPGYGQNKLNAAYSYGGAALLQDTVEQATGVQLDGYLEIGFEGFTDLVNAVGGIEVCVDTAVNDELSGLDLPAGCSLIKGDMALAYVRMRYSDPEGDIGRAKRQREVIGKVVAKAATPSTILNPIKYWSTAMAVASMLNKGDQTGLLDLMGAGMALLSVSGGNGLSLVVPIASTDGWTDDGQSVVIWDDAAAAELFGNIARGDTSDLDRFIS